MGLDQYWKLEPTNKEKTEALLLGEEAMGEQIGYHIKFWSLQHLLSKYANTEDFNCEDLIITKEIYQDLVNFNLSEKNQDLKIVLSKIVHYLAQGRTVIYVGWY